MKWQSAPVPVDGGAQGNIYFETIQAGLLAGFTFDEILLDETTDFQHATLVKTQAFGTALFLDGILNSAQADEFIYHEALVHPAMIRGPRRRVLVVGGAEGGVIREVLKYQDVEEVVMVDIDAALVRLCQKHLSETYGNPWNDDRLELVHIDGRAYLESSDPFDVIILDLNEATEEGPARLLFTREFYSLIRDRLNPGGMVSMQSEWINTGFHFDLTKTQKSSLGEVVIFEVSVPSFLLPEALNLACKSGFVPLLSEIQVDSLLAEAQIGTRFYNGAMDQKMRTLSPVQMEGYRKPARIFSDHEPPRFEDSEVQNG